MPSFSYQEKSLYANLTANLFIYVHYFIYSLHHAPSLGRLVATIATMVVFQIIVQVIIAATTRNRLKDERDELIELRGYRAGYLVLVLLIISAYTKIYRHGSGGMQYPPILHFLNVIFCMLVIADVVRVITQLIAYRRGL